MNFKSAFKVIERFGGDAGDDKALMLEQLKSAGRGNNKTATKKEKATAAETAKCEARAIAFLKGAGRGGC